MFAKFIGKIVFKAKTPLHIGGIREANVLRLMRLPDGRMIIPSTTWKGAFRAIAEKLAPSLAMSKEEELAVKYLLNGYSKLKIEDESVTDVLKILGYTEDEIKVMRDEEKCKIYLSYHCPIGKLFGNNIWASRIRFLDTILSANTETRTGIGINRKSGTAKTRVLYCVETTAVGLEIPLIIVGELYRDTSAKIFASTLEFVKEFGVSIGARKSVGLGHLTIKDAKFYVVDLSKDDDGKRLANPFKSEPVDIDSFINSLKF